MFLHAIAIILEYSSMNMECSSMNTDCSSMNTDCSSIFMAISMDIQRLPFSFMFTLKLVI